MAATLLSCHPVIAHEVSLSATELAEPATIALTVDTDQVWVEVFNHGIDTEAHLSALDESWRLASWLGAKGWYTAVLSSTAAELRISRIGNSSQQGYVTVRYGSVSQPALLRWQRVRAEMEGLAAHYRYYSGESSIDDAIAPLHRAIELSKAQGNRAALAKNHYELGWATFDAQTQHTAEQHFQTAREIWLSLNNQSLAAEATNMLGRVWQRSDRMDKAYGSYAEALRMFELLGEPRGSAMASSNIGFALWELGLHRNAQPYFEDVLAAAKLPTTDLLKRSAQCLSADLSNLVQLIAERIDLETYLAALNNLALTYEGLGDNSQATMLFRCYAALTLYHHNRESFGYASNNLGRALINGGEIQEGLRMLEAAEARFQDIQHRDGLALTLNNLADTYVILGLYEKAQTDYGRALEVVGEQFMKRRVDSMLGLGDAYIGVGEYTKASAAFAKALELIERSSFLEYQAEVSASIAKAQLLIGNSRTAKTFNNRAKQYFEHHAPNRVYVEVLAMDAEIALSEGQYELAEARVGQGIDTAVKAGDAVGESRMQQLASRLARELGDWRKAIRHAKAAILPVEKIRASIGVNLYRASYLATRRNAYFELAQLHAALGQHEQSLRVANAARSRVLIERMLSKNSSGPIDTADAYASLRQLQERRLAFEEGSELRRLLDQEIAEIALTLEPQSVPRESAAYSRAQLPAPAQGEIIIQFFLTAERGLVYWIDDAGIHAKVMEGDERLRSLVQRLQSSGRRLSPTQWTQLSHELYQRTIGLSGLHGSGANLVTVISDGVMHHAPLASLSTHADHYAPLLDLVTIRQVAQLNVTANSQYRKASPGELLIVADPIFDQNDRRLASGNADTTSDLSHAEYPLLRGKYFSRLSHSATESQYILSVFPGKSKLLTGAQATLSAYSELHLQRYDYLHFATHAIADSDSLEMSGLVFSKFDEKGATNHYFLSAGELRSKQLNAELVVLSACETNLGPRLSGEGPMGLARAFLEAGANSVVSSLWQVEDQATYALMTHMYRYHFVEKQPAHQALTNAQRAIRAERRWAHPYYWAGFVIQSASL